MRSSTVTTSKGVERKLSWKGEKKKSGGGEGEREYRGERERQTSEMSGERGERDNLQRCGGMWLRERIHYITAGE